MRLIKLYLAASAGALLPAGEQVACHARTEARWLLKRKRPQLSQSWGRQPYLRGACGLYKAADRRKILLLADQIMKSACGRLSLPRAHAIATAQFELERARSAEASLLRRIAEGTLAELEPMDRKSALNGLKMVRRY